MKTVKEAFEKAYGPLPEGATCHLTIFCEHIIPAIMLRNGSVLVAVKTIGYPSTQWHRRFINVHTPVIDELPAKDFAGWFGPEYDKAVSE